MAQRIHVFDSSALFHIKSDVSADRQWGLFEEMKLMVMQGEIAVPRQVLSEARNARHHDGPEIWLLGVASHLQYPLDCSLANHAKVMTTVGSRLVDPDAEGDPADPYVVALAMDLMETHDEVVVISDDHIDRPPMISLSTACGQLGVDHLRLSDFLADLGYH